MPGSDLLFLMSAELVSGPDPEFARWHEPTEIARLATLVIAPRPGYPPNLEFPRGTHRGRRPFHLPA